MDWKLHNTIQNKICTALRALLGRREDGAYCVTRDRASEHAMSLQEME